MFSITKLHYFILFSQKTEFIIHLIRMQYANNDVIISFPVFPPLQGIPDRVCITIYWYKNQTLSTDMCVIIN